MKKVYYEKILSLVITFAIVLSFFMVAMASSISNDNILENYITTYFAFHENKNVTVDYVKELKSTESDDSIAVCLSLNDNTGYVIADIKTFDIYEHSLYNIEPYYEYDKNLYYCGIGEYYYKNSTDFIHMYSGERIPVKLFSSSLLNKQAKEFYAVREEKPLSDLHQKIDKLNKLQNRKSATYSKYLTSSLATDWINGYCGPTSAYNMLKYRNLIYASASLTPTEQIQRIARYTGTGVSLSSLKNGINTYLYECGYSASVGSSSYSFNLVKTQIGKNRPLTLGTNGGGLATGGHVQTIHGYKQVYYGVGSEQTITLYVNNSWGKNNIPIPYDILVEGDAPSYLKDHVYYTA